MRKQILILVGLVSIFTFLSFANKTDETVSKDGIVFEQTNWQQALEKAKTENKFVFVDFYTSWCGYCKKLKRKTFSDKEVGDYYNKNFINIAIDGESEEGISLVKKYGINGYPTLLIVDSNGQLKTKQVGFVEPHILVNFGKRIVP